MAATSLADVDDVTLPQFRALVVLSTRPGMGVSDLAGALHIHASTATRLCDRLEAKGLVHRRQGREDRRATELELTRPGHILVDRVTRRRRRDLAAIASRLPAEVAAAAVTSLTAFAEAAGEPVGVDVFGWSASSPASSPADR